MGRIVWIVMSGLVEDMDFTNFEGVFADYDKAKEYVEKCNAIMSNDGYFYNSAEIYDIRQEKVR